MTGAQIHSLREALGLDPYQFATVLGVAVSTVYRWESSQGEVRVDPLQAELLSKLQQRLAAQRNKELAAQAGRAIVTGLLAGGMLVGLAALIEYLTKEPESAASPSARSAGRTRSRARAK